MALSTSRSPRSRAGFTMVELLTATALFTVLSMLMFQMVRGALDVWKSGESNRELNDRAEAVFDLLAHDLRHVWPGVMGAAEQDARLVCSDRVEAAGSGVLFRTPVLRFTRVLHEARTRPWLREAGRRPGAAAVARPDGRADAAELGATGGLAESLYTRVRAGLDGRPALVRRVRLRAGGSGSLVAADLVERPDRLLVDAVEIATDVLYFGCTFDAELEVWDSTRGLLSRDEFPHAVGSASLWAGHDDVWPRSVRVELVLDDGGESWQLVSGLGVQGDRLELRGRVAPEVGARLLLDHEWVELLDVRAGELIVARGVRGTVPAAHDGGVVVRRGRAFERTFVLPAGRELLR